VSPSAGNIEMVLMADTPVSPGTQTPMFLQPLEKPQGDLQQQPLEALPPIPPRSMVNPPQPVPHQRALLQLRPLLSQSPLQHLTTPLFQLLLLINWRHLLPLLLGLPVVDLSRVRQRRPHLCLRNLVYPLLQLWQRRSPKYVALLYLGFADGRTHLTLLLNIDDSRRMRCIKLRNLLEIDNLPNSRNSRRLSRYASASAFRYLADVRWHYQSPKTCYPSYPRMPKSKKRLKLVPLNKFWNPKRKQPCRQRPTRPLLKHPPPQEKYP
jgi:hypothetical protein